MVSSQVILNGRPSEEAKLEESLNLEEDIEFLQMRPETNRYQHFLQTNMFYMPNED
jgi:hypothetical protein